MGEPNHPLRVLGLSNQDLSGFRTSFSRFAGLFVAIEDRYDLIGLVCPEVSRGEFYTRALRSVHPRKQTWVARAGLSSWAFRRRSEIAEAKLRQWDGQYDVLLQLQTLFAPGVPGRDRPYAIYTDNIYPLVAQYYPAWAPLGARRGAAWAALERTVCRNAQVVFTMGGMVRDAIIDQYGCDPQRVVRVGGGANLMTEDVSLKQYDRSVALFVGDKFRIKGGDTLLEAWPEVRKRLPSAELWIVGPPARRTHDHDGVRWFGYVADRSRLAGLYGIASVFVLPSLFEAWGHAFLEAMAHGLPCIGTDQFAMPEIIQHGVTGLLVPPRESQPLADALTSILGDPIRAHSMGKQAYEEIRAGGTWDHVLARMAPHLEAAAPRA